jgi:hypothetical protein
MGEIDGGRAQPENSGPDDGRVTIPVLLEQIAFKPKGVEAKLVFHIGNTAIRHALVDAQGKDILIVVGESRQPELPLENGKNDRDEPIVAGDESEPTAGRLTSLVAERWAARKDPYAAGKAAGLQGFTETRNPFPHPSVESADWLRGHAEGEQEREAAATTGKRRRRRPPNGQEPATPTEA